jgi:hypothetical protein
MSTKAIILLLVFTKCINGQSRKELISVPTDGQIALSITMMKAYGELNFPEVFKNDSCYYIYNTGLIDTLAIPSSFEKLNEKINIISDLKIDAEKNFDNIQSLMKDFVSNKSDDIKMNTHCCLKNKETCIQVMYSPVFADRVFTAILRKPITSYRSSADYFVIFILDEDGDIVFFEVYDEKGVIAR